MRMDIYRGMGTSYITRKGDAKVIILRTHRVVPGLGLRTESHTHVVSVT